MTSLHAVRHQIIINSLRWVSYRRKLLQAASNLEFRLSFPFPFSSVTVSPRRVLNRLSLQDACVSSIYYSWNTFFFKVLSVWLRGNLLMCSVVDLLHEDMDLLDMTAQNELQLAIYVFQETVCSIYILCRLVCCLWNILSLEISAD